MQSALNAKFNADDAGGLATGDDASDVPVSGLSAPFDTAENVEQALALLRSAAGRDVGTDPDNMPDIEIADARYARLAGGAAANFEEPPQVAGQGMDDRYVIALSGTTGTAIFDRASNLIQRSGIVTALDLEPGDVIEIAGTNDNNNIYTVEHVISDDAVEVNRAHSNGAGPLSLTDETTTATITRLSKWYNAPLGLGQAWVVVTSSRALDTNYTNTTGRAMALSVTSERLNYLSRVWLTVDGVETEGAGATRDASLDISLIGYIFSIVPPGSIYSARSDRNVHQWRELR